MDREAWQVAVHITGPLLSYRWYHKGLGFTVRTWLVEFTSQDLRKVASLLLTSVFSFVGKKKNKKTGINILFNFFSFCHSFKVRIASKFFFFIILFIAVGLFHPNISLSQVLRAGQLISLRVYWAPFLVKSCTEAMSLMDLGSCNRD